MSESRQTALITWTSGDRAASPVLLLHDRYADHDQLDGLGALLAPAHRIVAARSARTQQENTIIKGYYWFLGAYEKPEFSTFGDGLHHLERLLLTLSESGQRVTLIGKGEGGTMALVLALVWRELVASVVSIDGPLPISLAGLPLSIGPAADLPVCLIEDTRSLEASAIALTGLGAAPERSAIPASHLFPAIADWVDRHPAGTVQPA